MSHEFRTPLTLMLGPVEELLSRSHTDLSPAAKSQLEVAHRNSLRLLRLVNTLLDFSRVEAGRVRAVFEPTDLAAFTAELASVFRSATERAGLALVVDCAPLSEPVYVDRDMWEKIVLNLVSNAFKFTFEGRIEVAVRAEGSNAILIVRDTGVGIPAEALPRLFERFHRVQNMRGRTHEGSGIGLALVQELVKLHHGSVRVESRLGEGSAFTVCLPLGKAHLPAEELGGARNLASTATGAAPFIEEALRWLPEAPDRPAGAELPTHSDLMAVPCPPGSDAPRADRPRVLVAAATADMRDYVVRLLAERYVVEAVPDGQAALAAATERRPDLILSDVMMPGLDGFELVQRLRADSSTREIPIILLSARAGEESRIEGLQTGADDYLIKPFSARELVARVQTHLQLARVRRDADRTVRESEQRLRRFYDSGMLGVFYWNMDGKITDANDRFLEMMGYEREDLGRIDWLGMTPPEYRHLDEQSVAELRATGVNRVPFEKEYIRKDGTRMPIIIAGAILDDARFDGVAFVLDITARKRAEEQLREGEARFRSVLENSHAVIYRLNVQTGRYEYVSPSAEAVVGFSPDELTAMDFEAALAMVHPYDAPAMLATVARLQDTVTEVVEYRQRTRNGGYRLLSNHMSLVKDSSGRPLYRHGNIRDVTERKHAEAALRESEERYRTLFSTLIEGFCVIEVIFDSDNKPVDYRFLEINPAFESQTGLHNAKGRRMRELAPDHEAHWFKIYGNVALTGRPARFVNEAKALDRWYDVSAYRVGGPESRNVAILFNDITKRKRAETRARALQQITAALAAAITPEQVGDVVLNQASQTLGAAAAVMGLIAEGDAVDVWSSLGVSDEVLARWGRKRMDTRTLLTDVVRTGRAIVMPSLAEYAAAYPDILPEVGPFGLQAVAGIPLTVGDRVLGAVTFIFSSSRAFSAEDVAFMETIAGQAAQAVERARLYRTVQSQAQTLAINNEELREADRRKNEFLAMLSHELRNPLAPIRSGLYILNRAAPGSEQARRAQAVVDRQVGHMTRIVDDLLDVTRISRGKLQLRRESLDFVDVVRRAIDDHRALFAANNLELQASIPDEPIRINGDRTRVAQVVGNLLQNAAKFTPAGGTVTVIVEADDEGRQAVVRVRDTGPGITAEMLPQIFEPFTQADTTLDRSKGGLGLGLSLVKGIMEMHGGTTSVVSEGPGRGAEFVVGFPRETSRPAATRPARGARQRIALRRVLIIEDNVDAAESLREVLELDGHTVDLAFSGAKGIEKAKGFLPEVVLCDIGLPGMDGYAVARAIRADPALQAICLVALTGYAGPDDIERSRAAGFDHHLPKPPGIETLDEILASLPT